MAFSLVQLVKAVTLINEGEGSSKVTVRREILELNALAFILLNPPGKKIVCIEVHCLNVLEFILVNLVATLKLFNPINLS